MPPQTYSWTCSVCTFTWCIGATGTDPELTRYDAGILIGYPNCVNELYGLMSSQCLIDAFAQYGLHAVEEWCNFDRAYYLATHYTGGISPQAMYHWMAIRGVDGDNLWVANSAPGYMGVGDILTRDAFNRLGPVKVIYLAQYIA